MKPLLIDNLIQIMLNSQKVAACAPICPTSSSSKAAPKTLSRSRLSQSRVLYKPSKRLQCFAFYSTQPTSGHQNENQPHKIPIGESPDFPATSYVPPEGKAEEEVIQFKDEALTVRHTDYAYEGIQQEVEDLTIYRAFQRGPEPPHDLGNWSYLEERAILAIMRMASTTDIHVMKEEAQAARDDFEEYLGATHNYGATSNVLFHLGLACRVLKDWQATYECMMTALDMDSNLIPAKRYVAEALQGMGKHPEAIHYFDEFFNDFPKYYSRVAGPGGTMTNVDGTTTKANSESILADVVFARGRSYFSMKEFGTTTAKEDFKSVIRLGSKHKANALLYLGLLEARDRDYWKAIKYYDLALQYGPASWLMYKNRADAWRALGKEERADEDEKHASLHKRHLHWTHQMDNRTAEPTPDFDMSPYMSSPVEAGLMYQVQQQTQRPSAPFDAKSSPSSSGSRPPSQ